MGDRVMTPQEVLKLCKQKNVQFIDLRFMDFPGLWQHTTCPISELTIASFEHGFGFDGSSIRGWKAIDESDMLVVPDPNTAVVDPFFAEPTLVMIADVVDPITKEDYARDPRGVARRCEQYLAPTEGWLCLRTQSGGRRWRGSSAYAGLLPSGAGASGCRRPRVTGPRAADQSRASCRSS